MRRAATALRGFAMASLLFSTSAASAQTIDLDEPQTRRRPPISARGDSLFAQLASSRDMLAVERWRSRAAGFDRGDHALRLEAIKLRDARAPFWEPRERDRFTSWDFAAAYRVDFGKRDTLTIETRALLGRRRTALAGFGTRVHGANALAASLRWDMPGGAALSAGWIGVRRHGGAMPARMAEIVTDTPLAGNGARASFAIPVMANTALSLEARRLRVSGREMIAGASSSRGEARLAVILRADF